MAFKVFQDRALSLQLHLGTTFSLAYCSAQTGLPGVLPTAKHTQFICCATCLKLASPGTFLVSHPSFLTSNVMREAFPNIGPSQGSLLGSHLLHGIYSSLIVSFITWCGLSTPEGKSRESRSLSFFFVTVRSEDLWTE